MLNDVNFNDISAEYDWNIILTKSEIPLPVVKTALVDIKGANGILDLSEVLTGDVVYGNREIKLTFEMMDDTDYHKLITDIANSIHGKKIKLSFRFDPEYYYVGRAYIDSWEHIKQVGAIVIKVDADPYKYYKYETNHMITVNGSNKLINLRNDRMRVSPTLDVSGNITMTFEGKTYQLSEGKQQILNFTLNEGDNIVTFNGNGTVKITYRKGCL